MRYELTPSLLPTDMVVIGTFSDTPLLLDELWSKKEAETILRLSKGLEEAGDYRLQSEFGTGGLLLICCGKKEQYQLQDQYKRLQEVVALLKKQRVQSAAIALPCPHALHANQHIEHLIAGFDQAFYQFQDLKSKPKASSLSTVYFVSKDASKDALQNGCALVEGIRLCKKLANLPANICTPLYIEQEAVTLERDYQKIKVQSFGPEALTEMNMNAFMAVAKGSDTPPRLIEIQYQGGVESAPIVLVGKGITFDSGGISIKPSQGMEEMKFDMGGAASVLGTLKACAMMNLPINVVGLLACAENMPSGHATKPGDVVTSASGTTIEITNTDAEGRLVLCDTLTYARRFNPEFVIDIATLTGAMIIALGYVNTGFMTEDDDLAQRIISASQESLDKAWRMPLQKDYQDMIESPIADILNSTGDRAAGSVTAACFLSRFTEGMRWAHMDIAGTAWVSGKNRQATGRPVPLLTTLLRHHATHSR